MGLWPALAAEMGRVRVGMLGVQGSALPLCPMLHLPEREVTALWFLAEADADLVKTVAAGGCCGIYAFVGADHDFYASLAGPIRTVPDRRGLETVWTDAAEARFPGGLGDIEWMPLRLELRDAALWQGQPAIHARLQGNHPRRAVR